MSILVTPILFGILGGSIRALVGIVNFEKNKKDQRIHFWYLAFSLFVAALVDDVAGD